MSFQGRSLDEREAASIVAGLHSNNTSVRVASASSSSAASKKRPATVNEKRPAKKRKKPPAPAGSMDPPSASARGDEAKAKKKDPPPMDATGLVFAQPELKPAPYFYYTDHSLERDDDPLTPIIAAGSVPTFPAKMHAILTNPQLADVVGWAPHGRSWRILKPRDFEIRVLPKYFEHSKFSSFVRQANGWGFRRMSHGYDKNAYYHEYFLRAMPWLCKKMRRPKVAEKKAVNPDMEPDLDAISLQLPVPDAPPTREVLVLQKTIELGPKARMPVMWDTGTPPQAPSSPVGAPQVPPPAVENPSLVENFPPLDRNTSYGDLKPAALPNPPPVAGHTPQDAGTVSMVNMGNNVHNILPQNSIPPPSSQNNMNAAFTYAAAGEATPSNRPNNTNEASLSSLASDSNFAAGFMAATAYHSNHIRNMLSSAFVAGMPIPSNGNVVMPSAVAATAPVTSAAHLGSAFELLQRVGMAQANLHPQESPGFAAVAATSAARTGGNTNRNFNNNSALSGQAMQRLQQFQEFSSKFY